MRTLPNYFGHLFNVGLNTHESAELLCVLKVSEGVDRQMR